ncbi:ABC transporter ATP-binding protein [Actibacterium sp. MT2.3-13A]|uniref:ABC transporter ATP-binding protein n=1 Tax=Actibacterium sp. MT2.3-13A TaxID=2828332 RepID=UPI001BA6A229|nr:ABC transporter ATP-binding protein [Actibacterium sp. MT2.3-13A]
MKEVGLLDQREDATAGLGKSILEISDLKVHFDAGEDQVAKAVNGVSLRVAPGETLAVVGESGSGKSVTGLTVMRILMRAPARIVGGKVLYTRKDGRQVDLLTLSEKEMSALRGSEISMIFQDPMSSLNPVFSVGEQIAEGLRLHQRLSRRAARSRAIELLELVGIAEPEARVAAFPHQLSGGMRQRVMIAMALACAPRLLIADEPTTALDVTIQAQIMDLLKSLKAQTDMAMIFVTHDLNLVSEIADRVAVMYCGQVVEEGEVAEVLERPRHPYTRALMACMPQVDPDTQKVFVQPIPGRIANPLSPPDGCKFHPRCGYVTEACRAQEISLRDTGQGHMTRCIRWGELG